MKSDSIKKNEDRIKKKIYKFLLAHVFTMSRLRQKVYLQAEYRWYINQSFPYSRLFTLQRPNYLTIFGEGEAMIFVTASHQTGLETRSKARRSIKLGIKGRGRSETSRDSIPAGHWPTKCNVGLMSQAVSQTQIWVRTRMPDYDLN